MMKHEERKIRFDGRPATLRIEYGLHTIGDQKPYFSLTGEVWYPRRSDCECCGMIHDVILDAAPEFADLAALHLSDAAGAPTHAVANGWYWLAGYLGAARTFTGRTNSNGDPLPDRTEYTSATAEFLRDTPLAIFSRHIRTTEDEASRIAARIVRSTVRGLDDPDALYAAWVRECDGMRPRWKAEAQAAIEHHGLMSGEAE